MIDEQPYVFQAALSALLPDSPNSVAMFSKDSASVPPAPERWVTCPQPDPTARLRLFCFPFAGGGASTYRSWVGALPGIEVWLIQPPGREIRFQEPHLTSVAALAAGVLAALPLDRPYAFFGHSLGAAVAYETSRMLAQRHLELPVRLIVSARSAPNRPSQCPYVHTLPNDRLIAELRRLGGTPEAILADAELMALLLPVLRSDLAASETYHPAELAALPCLIVALVGEADSTVASEDAAAWQAYSTAGFQLHVLPGGHFFLQSQRERVLRIIADCLSSAGI